mmetsp:Transcript_18383/g.27887  ORF Transcript_18383/g.27887 Transcript_18383/m.27887 type:complete len:211 (+) Transcript_18383:665-1297(+)
MPLPDGRSLEGPWTKGAFIFFAPATFPFSVGGLFSRMVGVFFSSSVRGTTSKFFTRFLSSSTKTAFGLTSWTKSPANVADWEEIWAVPNIYTLRPFEGWFQTETETSHVLLLVTIGAVAVAASAGGAIAAAVKVKATEDNHCRLLLLQDGHGEVRISSPASTLSTKTDVLIWLECVGLIHPLEAIGKRDKNRTNKFTLRRVMVAPVPLCF